MHTVRLHYTEELVRAAVKAFWLRVVGWKFFVGVTIITTALTRLISHGKGGWFVGLLVATLVLAVGGAATVYVTHLRSSLTRLRRMRVPEADLEMSLDRLRIASDVAETEGDWKIVTELWRFPDFWLLFFSPAQFVTLPTADLDDAAREFLSERVRQNGGKVS